MQESTSFVLDVMNCHRAIILAYSPAAADSDETNGVVGGAAALAPVKYDGIITCRDELLVCVTCYEKRCRKH